MRNVLPSFLGVEHNSRQKKYFIILHRETFLYPTPNLPIFCAPPLGTTTSHSLALRNVSLTPSPYM